MHSYVIYVLLDRYPISFKPHVSADQLEIYAVKNYKSPETSTYHAILLVYFCFIFVLFSVEAQSLLFRFILMVPVDVNFIFISE